MTVNDPAVYRATATATAEWVAARDTMANARRDAAKQLLADHGLPESTAFYGSNENLWGLVWRAADIPAGWREDRTRHDVIVPNRRTKLGKQIAAELDAIPSANAREQFPGGMPQIAMSRVHASLLTPGAAVYDGRLYVTWSRELDEGDARRIDAGVWERVPLSWFYAAKEKEAARVALKDGDDQ